MGLKCKYLNFSTTYGMLLERNLLRKLYKFGNYTEMIKICLFKKKTHNFFYNSNLKIISNSIGYFK